MNQSNCIYFTTRKLNGSVVAMVQHIICCGGRLRDKPKIVNLVPRVSLLCLPTKGGREERPWERGCKIV